LTKVALCEDGRLQARPRSQSSNILASHQSKVWAKGENVSGDDPFLREISANPEDDTVRLVYADWLEDHGQAERAELIRVQTALADPPEDGDKYRALRAQEAALLDRHGKEWFAPLRKRGVRAWVLRRGLVERVTLSASRFLEHADPLLALAPIHTVHLTGARPLVGELAKCSSLARLSGLDLSGNKLRKADVQALLSPHLAGLRRLDLSDNPLGPGGVEVLTTCPHLASLRCLALRGVKMGVEGAYALGGDEASVNLAGLTALDLRQNTIYEEGVTTLAHTPYLAGLTELSLSPIWGKDSEALNESPYWRKLTILRISGDFSEGIPLLLECRFVKGLRVLELNGTRARDEHAEEIADCRHLGKVQHLGLAGNFIGDDGLLALASRARLPALRWLDLNENRITSAGVSALCDSALAKPLRELDLSGNQIDDAGVETLVGCSRLSRLNGLVLSRNTITDAGATALAGSPLLQQLEGLNLNGNPIGTKGARALCRAAHEAGIPQRGGNDYWIDPQRSRRERFRDAAGA
jgi:uncharacterized protein (TIGR02996 family)